MRKFNNLLNLLNYPEGTKFRIVNKLRKLGTKTICVNKENLESSLINIKEKRGTNTKVLTATVVKQCTVDKHKKYRNANKITCKERMNKRNRETGFATHYIDNGNTFSVDNIRLFHQPRKVARLE